MNELNKLKVVDFTAGRLSSDDINTDIPFRDNFDKTRTIQQANAVIGAYVNRNYKDMQNKANIDDIPTKVSELENDSGYITEGDIPTKTSDLENDSGFITSTDVPTKTSDLTNDGANGIDPFITADDIPTIPTNTSDLYNDSGYITKAVNDLDNYTNNTTLTSLLNDKASKTVGEYNANETVVGTFLGKPLYRKVLESTIYATSYQIPANNIDKIPNISGMVKRNDYDIWQFIPSRLDNASFKAQFDNIQYSNTSATVNVSFGTSWASAFSRIIIILEYTKTTD